MGSWERRVLFGEGDGCPVGVLTGLAKKRKVEMDGNADLQRESNVGGITGKGFMPGRSGNPIGRLPGSKNVATRMRELLESNQINGKPIEDGKQVADLLAETILKASLKGNFRFVSMILDRTEGKVPDKIQQEGAFDVTLHIEGLEEKLAKVYEPKP